MTNSVNESATPTVDDAIASTNQKQDAVTNDTKELEVAEIKQETNSNVNNNEFIDSNITAQNNVPQVSVNCDATSVDQQYNNLPFGHV